MSCQSKRANSKVPRAPVRKSSHVICNTGCHSYPNPSYRSYSEVVAAPAPHPTGHCPMRPLPSRPRSGYNWQNKAKYPIPGGAQNPNRHNQMTSSRPGSGRFVTPNSYSNHMTSSRPQPYGSHKAPRVSWKKLHGGNYQNRTPQKIKSPRKTYHTPSGPVELLDDDAEIERLSPSQIEKVLNLVALHSHCNVSGGECQINDSSSCGTEIHQKRLDQLLCKLSSGTPLPSEAGFVKVKNSQCNYL